MSNKVKSVKQATKAKSTYQDHHRNNFQPLFSLAYCHVLNPMQHSLLFLRYSLSAAVSFSYSSFAFDFYVCSSCVCFCSCVGSCYKTWFCVERGMASKTKSFHWFAKGSCKQQAFHSALCPEFQIPTKAKIDGNTGNNHSFISRLKITLLARIRIHWLYPQ